MRAGFSCGHEKLDHWFQNKAERQHGISCRVTTVHAPDREVPVAFFAFAFTVWLLNRKHLPLWPEKDRFPALNLDVLAVDTLFQGRGLGQVVMGRVLADCAEVVRLGQIPAITLTPANSRAAGFYSRLGFVEFERSQNRPGMLLPASDLQNLLGV